MRKKTIIRIILLSIFTIVLIVGGIVFFQKLKSDKYVFAIELRGYIPKDVASVTEIRRASELKNVASDNKISSLIQAVGNEFSYPFYLVGFSAEEQVVVAKLSSSQESNVNSFITNSLYPAFPPQKRKYKTADILFYTTKDANEFFICSYFKGVFIAAYNYKSVQNIIDTEASESIFTDPFYEKVEPCFKSASLIYYQKTQSFSTVYSINRHDSVVSLDGYIDRIIEKPETDSLKVDQSVFPVNFEALQIDRNDHFFTESLSSIFKAPYYTFWIDSLSMISVTGFDMDRYKLYDTLNGIEKSLTAKSLVRHGYTMGKKYSIYSGSDLFTRKVFKSDHLVYFAFKEGYLLYSNNKEELYRYILSSENSDIGVDNIDDLFFYSKNPSKINHALLKNMNLNITPKDRTLTLKIYPDIKYYKIEVTMKHF